MAFGYSISMSADISMVKALYDSYGFSVRISADGSLFVVGAPFNDGNGAKTGQVRVYKLNPSSSSYAHESMSADGETYLLLVLQRTMPIELIMIVFVYTHTIL